MLVKTSNLFLIQSQANFIFERILAVTMNTLTL